MDRRTVLLTLGALGLGWSLYCCLDEPKKSGKVLVLGAGISGLAAANELSAKGFTVTVLEARERVGGRIWSDRSLKTSIDLGASWIHGASGNPIAKLASDFSVKTAETDYEDVLLFDASTSATQANKPLSESTINAINKDHEAILKGVSNLHDQLSAAQKNALSLAEAFKKVTPKIQRPTPVTQQQRDWRLYRISQASGAELKELSMVGFSDSSAFDGMDRIFPGGYDQITENLKKQATRRGATFKLQQLVKEIAYNDAGVKVTTTKGQSYSADAVVVTLPLGVLKRTKGQSGHITFTPELPKAKREAMGRLGMGVLNKVVLQFPKVFWPKDTQFFGYIGKELGTFPAFLNWYHYSQKPILMGFTGGDFARNLEKQSNDAIQKSVMAALKQIFGNSLPEPTGMLVGRWNSDPFTWGSYSHIRPGGTGSDYETMAETVGERVFFAGEATNRTYPATVHGAYLSGLREAQKIYSAA